MKSGSIVDANFVEAPRHSNTREENGNITNGEVTSNWSFKKASHKDVDVR